MLYTGPDQITCRCLREDETYDILWACHDEPCGGHFVEKRISYKILTTGYYWPTLHKDEIKYIGDVIDANAWEGAIKLMKCPYSHRW